MTDTQSTKIIPPEIEVFLDSCLWEKGIRNLPEDLHTQMIRDLASRLEAWLLQVALMHFDEKDAPALENELERGATQEEITQFLQRHIPNLSIIFEQEMLKFKQAYLKA